MELFSGSDDSEGEWLDTEDDDEDDEDIGDSFDPLRDSWVLGSLGGSAGRRQVILWKRGHQGERNLEEPLGRISDIGNEEAVVIFNLFRDS
jgi:hypothetical protein